MIERFFEYKRKKDKRGLEITRTAIANLTVMLDEEKLERLYGEALPKEHELEKEILEKAYGTFDVPTGTPLHTVTKLYFLKWEEYDVPDEVYEQLPFAVQGMILDKWDTIFNAYKIIKAHSKMRTC